jgi:hypothetical protein
MELEIERDGLADLTRHNLGSDVLNHRLFSDCSFEFVDEWCDAVSIRVYPEFLRLIYLNIRALWKTSESGGARIQPIEGGARAFSRNVSRSLAAAYLLGALSM